MSRSGIPYLDFAWNPCGFGCSRGCPTCWAAAQARGPYIRRICEQCGRFAVHFHIERIDQPARRKKPAVIGVEFTGELFDRERPRRHPRGARCGPRGPLAYDGVPDAQPGQGRRGTDGLAEDGRTQHAAGELVDWRHGDQQPPVRPRCNALHALPGHIWLSLEPLAGYIGEWMPDCIEGVIIGANNRASQPWSNDWARMARDAAQAAGAKVFIKQLWMCHCPRCDWWQEQHTDCRACGLSTAGMHWKLTREIRTFPADLRLRELPWTLTTKET